MISLKVFLTVAFIYPLFYASEAFKCPFQWFKSDAPGKCVQVSKVRRHYKQAREWCKMFGTDETEIADLVSIHSYNENHLVFALAKQVNTKDLWIGLSSEDGDPLQWTDGSFLDFKNFKEELKPESKTCISMLVDSSDLENGAKWFGNGDCLREMHFACEMLFNSTEEEVPSTTFTSTTPSATATTATTTTENVHSSEAEDAGEGLAKESTYSSEAKEVTRTATIIAIATTTKTTATALPFPCKADVVFVFDFTNYTTEEQRIQEVSTIEDIIKDWEVGQYEMRVGMANYGCLDQIFTGDVNMDEGVAAGISAMEDCVAISGNSYAFSSIFQHLKNSEDVSYLTNSRAGVPFTYVLFSASKDEGDIRRADSSTLCASPENCRILAIELNGAADLSSVSVPECMTINFNSSVSSVSSLNGFLVKSVCSDHVLCATSDSYSIAGFLT